MYARLLLQTFLSRFSSLGLQKSALGLRPMEQTMNRYSDAEVLERLIDSTQTEAAIRHLYETNFKPLSDFILYNQGSWQDVRVIIPYVMEQLVRLVQLGRYPSETSLQEFLFSLNKALWLKESGQRKGFSEPSAETSDLTPAAESTIQKAVEERKFFQLWIRSFEQLETGCKNILLKRFFKGNLALPYAPEVLSEREKTGWSKGYACLGKLEEVMERHKLLAQQTHPGFRNAGIYYEDLLRFVEGSMETEEWAKFQTELSRNRALQQDADRLAMEIEVVRYNGLVQQVASIQSNFLLNYTAAVEKKTSAVVLLKRLVRIGLAVAAIVFLVVLVMAGNYFFQLSTERLYNEAFVEYPISVSEERDSIPISIEEAYRQQNYAAIKKLSKRKKGYTDREFLLIGLAFLQLDDASSAVEPLRWVTIWPGSSYKPDAEYYLAMAYLKDKDYDKAMEVMQKIRNNPDHLYYDQFPKEYIRKVRLLKWR